MAKTLEKYLWKCSSLITLLASYKSYKNYKDFLRILTNKWRTALGGYFRIKAQSNILTEHLFVDAFKEEKTTRYRNSRPKKFCKKGAVKNFANFTGKHLCLSLFLNKVVGPRPATLLRKRLWQRCFPVELAKFLRTLFYRTLPTAASEDILLTISVLLVFATSAFTRDRSSH